MSKFKMGYDVSTGELVRAEFFDETAKLPDKILSASAKRRARRKRRKQKSGGEKDASTHAEAPANLPLLPAPQSWNWEGMNEYLMLIRHWIQEAHKVVANPTVTNPPPIQARLEGTIVAYLTLLFSMKEAREDQSDLVWVDRLEDILEADRMGQPYLKYITNYRTGWG